jgi:hypothetical protein
MQDSGSLAGALERARRERAEALPGGFAAGVMDRLQAEAQSHGTRFLPTRVIAAAIVFTAGVVSLYAAGGRGNATPPRLGMFGSPASHSPFGTTP